MQLSILTADIRQSPQWYYTTDNECDLCIGQVSTQALRCIKHIVNQGPNIYIYVQSNFEGPYSTSVNKYILKILSQIIKFLKF